MSDKNKEYFNGSRDEVIAMVERAGQVVPQVGVVGWDVCVTDNGPLLIEGNDYPGHDIYQLPPHRTNGIGVLPKFQKAIAECLSD